MKTAKDIPVAKLKKTPFSILVEPALRRAAKAARKTARIYGTPIYVSRNGKVVAIKP